MVYVTFEWDFIDDVYVAHNADFKLEVIEKHFTRVEDSCKNILLNVCEELFDNIASNEETHTPEMEAIASDVIQGLYYITLKRRNNNER